MMSKYRTWRFLGCGFCQVLIFVLTALVFSACSRNPESKTGLSGTPSPEPDRDRYLVAVEEEPDTVDFQCTSIHYTVALNVFDRLVEAGMSDDDRIEYTPSLAASWDISDDRRTYTFHLREGVMFSNGSPLTASDVAYTLKRLLTHPDSCNQDIALLIVGASDLKEGKTDQLAGVQVLGDLDLSITLEEPFEAFLASLSTPAASILDEETTKAAGSLFGKEPVWTVGTGPFILRNWVPDQGMLLQANHNCWSGHPGCEGLDLRFLADSETIRTMFENHELDILDLDVLGDAAEYYIHGDIYQDRLYHFPQIGISYIALNESTGTLNDARVRKALQLALNRQTLLDAAYSGRGLLEQGLFPHGLYGFHPSLPEIPYDPEEAGKLLEEAGYPDGFDLTISVSSSSTQAETNLVKLVASMWGKIGIRASVRVLDEEEFMHLRKIGALECYTATWIADYNDPDNFIYTFFGSRSNSSFRSLGYSRSDIIDRVQKARVIPDPQERLQEYRDLEQIIVQEDAAWIPLFSRIRYYVVSDNLENFSCAWNGSVKARYASFTLR